MKISNLALVLFSSSLVCSTARAQLAIYGTVTVREMTGIHYTQGTTTATNGSFDPIGGMFGAYYDLRSAGPVRLGVDLRGILASSTKGAYVSANAGGGKLSSGLGGVRASFHTPLVGLQPYVSGMVGVARTNFGTDYNTGLATSSISNTTGVTISTHLEYDVFAGLDYAILPLVDFRVVELGYGGVQGHTGTNPVGSVSSGIVIHIPFTRSH
jgi:hypothetical protein